MGNPAPDHSTPDRHPHAKHPKHMVLTFLAKPPVVDQILREWASKRCWGASNWTVTNEKTRTRARKHTCTIYGPWVKTSCFTSHMRGVVVAANAIRTHDRNDLEHFLKIIKQFDRPPKLSQMRKFQGSADIVKVDKAELELFLLSTLIFESHKNKTIAINYEDTQIHVPGFLTEERNLHL
eukprot:g67599.t1